MLFSYGKILLSRTHQLIIEDRNFNKTKKLFFLVKLNDLKEISDCIKIKLLNHFEMDSILIYIIYIESIL